MRTQTRALFHSLSLLIVLVPGIQLVCVDIPSETIAQQNRSMKLTCIACMKREEIAAETKVSWYYNSSSTNIREKIYYYDKVPQEVEGPWMGRLEWLGSKDLQNLSIKIRNVRMNDSGTFECVVFREFTINLYKSSITETKVIELEVRANSTVNTTALYSEIMMYVLLVFLTLWLLVEMVYCYRKISKSDEQAQDSATDYLAIPSENKDNPGPPVTE